MKIQPPIILLDLRLLDLEKVEAPLEFDKPLPQDTAYILYLLNVLDVLVYFSWFVIKL